MTKKSLFRPYKETVDAYLPPRFHIEADGRGKLVTVTISGVMGVKELSEEEVLINTKSEAITLRGALLSVTVLESNRIRVAGALTSISFSKRKNRGVL